MEAARSMPLTFMLGLSGGCPCLLDLRASLWLTLKMYCRYCLVALSMPLPEIPCNVLQILYKGS